MFLYDFVQYYSLGIGYYFAYTKNILDKRNSEAEQEILRAELKFLKTQLNSHFLFNSLNNIHSRAYAYSEDLADSIMKLSDIMRYALRDHPDGLVDLLEEVIYLQNFIGLNQARFKNKLNVDFKIDGDLSRKTIIPLVLASFVENAFKHGQLDDSSYPVSIHLQSLDTQINFKVQNKKSKSTLPSTKIGNMNIKRRLDLMYGKNYELNFSEDDDHFVCELSLQY